MLEDKLAINLITYNRAAALDRTLTELRASPFAHCRITILDNCSTDETPAICARHQANFPDLHIVRHPKNIGLSANYLRAVEISDALYTWVLCDDDSYDWSACDDVIEQIEAATFDWICVGAPHQKEWERGLKTTTQELWKRGNLFFIVHTFVPSLIFKTALFDSACMFEGYKNAINLYPHVPFLIKALENNFSEYVSKRPVVHREIEYNAYSGLDFMLMFYNSCAIIPDAHTRRMAIYGGTKAPRAAWLRDMATSFLYGKLATPAKAALVPQQYSAMLRNCVGEQRNRLLLLAPLVAVPAPIYRGLQKVWHKLKSDSLLASESTNSSSPAEQFRS